MKYSVQTDNLIMLEEATKSKCDKIRFGPEFCELKIPSLFELERAYQITRDAGKTFVYVTPRVSDRGLQNIQKQLGFLNEKEKVDVVINDLGTLRLLSYYSNLSPHLGRQLIYIPARCPWLKMKSRDILLFPHVALSAKVRERYVKDLYYQTSLNYMPTIRFFQSYGVRGVDLDWIPQSFPNYYFLANAGLNLSIHLHLIPVTLTRKCHAARLLGEKKPENCTKPCNTKVFLLKNRTLGAEFFLLGNTVFKYISPTKGNFAMLKSQVSEFVIAMNSITNITSQQKIDELILDVPVF